MTVWPFSSKFFPPSPAASLVLLRALLLAVVKGAASPRVLFIRSLLSGVSNGNQEEHCGSQGEAKQLLRFPPSSFSSLLLPFFFDTLPLPLCVARRLLPSRSLRLVGHGALCGAPAPCPLSKAAPSPCCPSRLQRLRRPPPRRSSLQADHSYICQHHKNLINTILPSTAARPDKRRKRMPGVYEGGDTSQVNFDLLSLGTLRRYREHYKLGDAATKQELVQVRSWMRGWRWAGRRQGRSETEACGQPTNQPPFPPALASLASYILPPPPHNVLPRPAQGDPKPLCVAGGRRVGDHHALHAHGQGGRARTERERERHGHGGGRPVKGG